MRKSDCQLLSFALADQRFAVPADDVQEIVRAVALARLPKAPPIIEGIINLRGSIVPVLDIRARFCLPAKGMEPSDHLIVARANLRLVAVRVDRALGLVAVQETQIEDIKRASPASEYVAGVAKLSDGLVLIHDLGTFLSDAEAEAVDASVELLAS